MKTRRFFWHLFPFVVGAVIFSIALCTWYGTRAMKRHLLNRTASDLKIRVRILQEPFARALAEGGETLLSLAQKAGNLSEARVTVILKQGAVAADSRADSGLMENHLERPEIKRALLGETAMDIRPSRTLNEPMMYVAAPLGPHGEVAGVLRLAVSIARIDADMAAIRRRMLAGGGFIALLALLVSLWISRRVSRPVEGLLKGAGAYAEGRLTEKIPIPETLELANLAGAMNHMALRLKERMDTVLRQRNEIEAVLSSMSEGVLAIDGEETIIISNEAAGRILDAQPGSLVGLKLQDVVRDTRFRRFADSAIGAPEPASADLEVGFEEDKTLRCHSTPLKDTLGLRAGTVFVFNDVTRIKLLENIRRDFAVNVSHEIRTPLTAIKGFVETLVEMGGHEPQAERFLGIIENNVRRLERIIEDLVALSRIENKEEASAIELTVQPLGPVVESAIAQFEEAARAKGIQIHRSLDGGVRAAIHPPLLERAVANLVHNAIAYSEPGKTIEVRLEGQDRHAVIRVLDHGVGIAARHQERIFERFYRVDEARSRDTGGTGLGLALVKHIVKVHGGRITLQSALGRGSTFGIRLPLAPRAALPCANDTTR